MARRPPPRELWLVGAGRMGLALLDGWIKAGLVTKSAPARIVEPSPSEALRARMNEGLALSCAPPFAAAGKPKFVVLAVKPQTLDAALAELRPFAAHAAFLSIVAGRTIESIVKALAPAGAAPPIIRSMPNLPASIGEGVTAAVAGAGVDQEITSSAHDLLAAVGEVVWLDDEGLIDAVTAVSGSGPAYVFNLVEALAEAGVAIGLPREAAERLARETVVGSAALLKSSSATPADLRQAVTSPGGTTQAALKILMGANGLGPLMRQTVEAALARAKALAKG